MIGAITLLGALGAIAGLNCDLERHQALPLAMASMVWASLLLRKELRRPSQNLLIPQASSPTRLDGVPLETLELLERGPLLVLRWRAAKGRGTLLFWPDTLPRARRRELRLAVRAHAVSCKAETVAP
ncbi:hypothetical protein [Stenotrophomonas sp. Iso1]|uniref:hypothetical protein n=1 Tax=Stenotrophomonas sp. Iso1 TaxID=2977283 RepID=UPI0022B78520|nr:hypothetical protein [Stenotrophomonas sp. Iso1]